MMAALEVIQWLSLKITFAGNEETVKVSHKH
jgi:hypothetical protein